MKKLKLILVTVIMLFSSIQVTVQKKKQAAPSRLGPIEMPEDAEVKVMPGD